MICPTERMKIRLFTIPNLITLASLVCGVVAIVEVLTNQNYMLVFWLVILASIFDFADGFVARAISQESAIGRELDSLCDLVSFGLVPTFVLFSMSQEAHSLFNLGEASFIFCYLSFIIVAFSALRLAKFNIDESQENSFVGLPTPANALFCTSLGLLNIEFSLEALTLIALIMASLLISPIEMFSLKFKSFAWCENRMRYIFLAIATIEIATLKFYSMPAIILTYILISIAMALRPCAKV